MTIRLFYNLYKDKNEARQKELVLCQRMNRGNRLIEIIAFESQDRPTFNSFFSRINNITGPDDINIIANSDIFFDQTIALTSYLQNKEVWALSRWDWASNPVHYDVPYSHDVWIFRGKVEDVYGDFSLGRRGCDGRINYEFYKSGYKIRNPSKTIKTYHVHSSGIRDYNGHWNNFVPFPWLTVTPVTLESLQMEKLSNDKVTTCLTMIVKNEEHVIERCLNSVKSLIDSWVIIDTGSTDNTKEVIKRVMNDIPGELVDRPWVNFGYNRTEALKLARNTANYSLWVDADDVLETDNKDIFKELAADVYSIEVIYSGTKYRRAHLLNNRLDWRFEGFMHEYPVANDAHPMIPLDGIIYKVLGGGARSLDPNKYANDAEILEKALLNDPDDSRAAFYLGQSYREAGEYKKAIDAYQKRIDMGGWYEEVWYSYYKIAELQERINASPSKIIFAYLNAYQYRPQRAESLYYLAKYLRLHNNYNLSFMFSKIAKEISRPSDILFLDESIYQWRILDEYAISAYYVGEHIEAISANQQLLDGGMLPIEERERIIKNLNFSINR